MRNVNNKSIVIVLLLVMAVACSHSQNAPTDTGEPGNPLSAFIAFYQGPLDHLSAVRSGQCPMYPSCSEYSRQCVERFGPIVGWVMAADRLMRCGRDELNLSPTIVVGGELKTYDPVDNNTLNGEASP